MSEQGSVGASVASSVAEGRESNGGPASRMAVRESTGMAFLKRANGETAGQIIELKPDRIVIGRSPEHCHVVLDPNGVSRRHAEIYRKGEEYFLADLNSRNMTKVNNTKVIPGNRSSPVARRPDQYLRRRVPVLPAACRRTVPPRNPATS